MTDAFQDIPAEELAELLDIVIWDTRPADPPPVAHWLAELQGRPDVETPEIHAAIEVCQDYLVARALLPVKNDKS